MYCLLNTSEDIYYNLALEEHLLRNKVENFVVLWQSSASVVIGKHQNAMAEINHRYLRQKSIPVARRLSGGGTVYHGSGNLNFTFIRNGEQGKLVDFKSFVTPVVNFLKEIGIEATIGTRNDILIGDLKISGNAEHVYKQRVLHHGTLLFNADLVELNETIRVVKGKYIDKAVQSNRSRVTNIADHLPESMHLHQFISQLYRYLEHTFTGASEYVLSEDDLLSIKQLREEKYMSEEWIFGYSPPFELQVGFTYKAETATLKLKVRRGLVENCQVNFSDSEFSSRLEKLLIGEQFLYGVLQDKLSHSLSGMGNLTESILAGLF